jgi:undecaprenyldiphospho-muramoylpentapeptide beta-N-acetylglucosaminyltransferase
MRLLVCAGGTGGGIYPALATVNYIQQENQPEDAFLWVGVRGEMEEELIPRAGLPLATIHSTPLAGLPLTTQLRSLGKLAHNVWLARGIMRQFAPDVVLVTGGYMSVPVAMAAKLLGVPTIAFVPDVEPGAALKLIGRWVTKVAATVEDTAVYFPPHQTITTGYPVRAELQAASQQSREQALQTFQLSDNRPTLFVFGGSRGAQSINRALMTALPHLLEQIQVIHVSGQLTWAEVQAFAATLPVSQKPFYRPYPYLHEEMGAAFRSADLIVARAGASMLAEGPLFGTPAILVPYPHAWRYQKINADYLAERGAAIRLNDELLATELLPTVEALLMSEDKSRRQAMGQAAEGLGLNTAVGAPHLAQLLRQTARRTNKHD